MQTSKATPEWAIELVKQVCKDYKRTLPSVLNWYIAKDPNRESSSGATWPPYKAWAGQKASKGKIRITAGTAVHDQRLVLLHEIAHHITNKNRKKREHHSIKFWRVAFELYSKYFDDMEYAYKREKDYRKKATQAYDEVRAKN